MKKIPPHLPPQVCDIKTHHSWQRLKILLAAAVFGLVAGMSGASIILGWIWPGYGGGDVWVISQQNRTALNRTQLEDRVRIEVSDRIVSVYSQLDGNTAVGYVRAENKIGDAVVLSSDGWLAMYHKGGVGNYKKWKALAAGGAVYDFEKALFDDKLDVLFLKISLQKETDVQRSGGQFKVVSFAEKSDLLDEVYAFNDGGWQYSWISALVSGVFGVPHADGAPAWGYRLRYDFAPGAVVVSGQGKVVGLVANNGYVISSEHIMRPMSQVLEKQKIIYSTLGVEGWYDFEWPIIVNGERRSGFYVSRIMDIKSPLHIGDVITEIDGKVLGGAVGENSDLWYNLNGKSDAQLIVWRVGKSVAVISKINN